MSRPAGQPEEDVAGARLLARIRAGDPDAVSDLFQRYGKPAFSLARRILVDEVLAEDVVQEVFLSVWRTPSAFDDSRAGVSAWLMAMVHHKAVDAVRKEETHRRRRARAEEDLALSAPAAVREVGEMAEDRVVSQEVRSALGALPQPQREALTLAYYGGYTQREVAALTGVPLGTVKSRMLAGMRRLRKELARTAGELEDGSTPVDGATR